MFRYSKIRIFTLVLVLTMVLVNFGHPTLALANVPGRVVDSGTIEGSINFPSEVIPALSIYAISTSTDAPRSYKVQTRENQTTYSIDVQPGEYLVVAYYRNLAGGYTRFVTCGLSANCNDHTLLKVVVQPNAKISGVDVKDWYAPTGAFPTQPSVECQAYYTVKAGDNLYRIGLNYNLLWTTIAKANNLPNGNKIYAGQVLCIPVSSSNNVPVEPSTTTTKVPTITIVKVVRDQTVTIQASNFPVSTTFNVTMGKIGKKGVDGITVGSTDTGNSNSFSATYTIPQELHGQSQIAIRLQSAAGYFSYNWFYNSSTQ